MLTVEAVADAADGGLGVDLGEAFGVGNRHILGGFKRSSQHLEMEVVRHDEQASAAGTLEQPTGLRTTHVLRKLRIITVLANRHNPEHP